MSVDTVGFVGLGNMGSVLAGNLVEAGHDVVSNDVSGPGRSPAGAEFISDVTQLARRAVVVVLSLPDGGISEQVVRAIAEAPQRRVTHVVDTSTVGVAAAQAIDGLLTVAGVAYVDAPVSGGVAGALARTLSVMYAGTDSACRVVEPVLGGLSDRRRRVGDRPGMAQALKLANKFPNHVLTGRYAAGFANSLMSKDLRLYVDAVGTQGAPSVLGSITESVWKQFASAEPGADFSRIFPFVAGR